MGILNVTPDSFSDGGRHADTRGAVAHGRRMVGEGARWVDVGGESTRPGAEPVPEDEERRRVVPVVEALAADGIAVSVDTRKAGVARAAVAAGATMVNDVSARLGPVAGELGVAYVAMHMQGEPQTMQRAPSYDDVVTEVRDHLVAVAAAARAAGCPEVWIDPGFGFGKSLEHNMALLGRLEELVATGFPVLVGTSRKASLGRLAARADGGGDPTPPGDRLAGSLATAAWALAQGAGMVRAHDVAATAQVALAVEAASAAA
jgi:dihydropteroate synthase